MKKALIIRLSSAGDILLTATAIKALKTSGFSVHVVSKIQFEKAAIAAGADVFIPFVDVLKTAAYLNIQCYDAVIDLQNNLKSFLLRVQIKSPVKRLYNKNSMKRRLTVLFKWFTKEGISVSDKYMLAIKGLVKNSVKKIKTRAVIKNKSKIQFLIHAGAKWKNKRWPYVMQLAAELLKIKGASVVITGIKDEVEKTDGLLYYKGSRIKNLIGKTDFESLLDYIKKCDIFIGNDTAAAHAAILYGKPAFIFMGPTTGSFGFVTEKDFYVIENKELMCRPCHLHGGDSCPIGSFDCMKSILPQDVAEKIKQMMIR